MPAEEPGRDVAAPENPTPGDAADTPQRDHHDDLAAVIARARAMGQRALSLRHRGLATLPDTLAALDELLELDLTGNLLTALPPPLLALRGLEFLTLSRNRLTALADELWAFTALKDLDIGNAISLGPDQRYGAPADAAGPGNRIEALPAGLASLAGLRRLAAGFVGLRALPEEIGALGALIALELPGNALPTLPAAINQLTGLESLDLSSNPLTVLPDGLAGLSGLRSLRLANVAKPPAVAPLPALELLALPGCGLEALPDWVLAQRGLRSLYLAGNPMIDLPDGIAALSALSYLDLSGTGITEPPRHLTLPEGLIVRLGPQRLHQDGRSGHAIGPDGKVILLAGLEEEDDDDEETETGPVSGRSDRGARFQPSGGLGGAGGVVIHRRAGQPEPVPSAAGEAPTRIVRKTEPADDDGATRRGPSARGGLAARVQAAVAERAAGERGIAEAQAEDAGGDIGGDETGGGKPILTSEDVTGAARASAPRGGLAARVQAAVDSREAGEAATGQPDRPAADPDKTQMGKRAAARAEKAAPSAPPDPPAPVDPAGEDEQEETVSQPRDAEGRPIRKTPPR